MASATSILFAGRLLPDRQFQPSPSRRKNHPAALARVHHRRCNRPAPGRTKMRRLSRQTPSEVLHSSTPPRAATYLQPAPSTRPVARTSSDAVEIESICQNLLRMPKPRESVLSELLPESTPPPPKFDSHALAQLANASDTIYCECPKPLVDLILSLGSFERYSAECANRGPEDTALHRDLERTAGYARAMFDEALVHRAADDVRNDHQHENRQSSRR